MTSALEVSFSALSKPMFASKSVIFILQEFSKFYSSRSSQIDVRRFSYVIFLRLDLKNKTASVPFFYAHPHILSYL